MWYLDIQDIIYTKVKARATKNLIERYPNINFTKTQNGQVSAKFPTVYISYLQSNERGLDLERTEINGIQVNAQISVIVSKSQGELVAKEVMAEIIQQFKYMSFELYSTPIYMATSGETRQLSTYVRRNVDKNDTIV